MAKDTKTILILVNKQTTILNFRLDVVAALVNAGYRVYVSVPEGDRLKEIEAVGAQIILTPMKKESTDPFHDLALLRTYKKMIRQVGADMVMTYTIKPNVYGGMAAASCGVPYVATITGLGTALENGGLLQKLAITLYRLGFRKISKVFFQNAGNRGFFERHKLALGRHELVPGSGVNLEKFSAQDYPGPETIDFAFISRIRKEKGIEQYLDAARYIQEKYPNTRFHVCGFGDEYYEDRMRQLHEEGLIRYHGLLTDVRVMLADTHCVVHPTYYPEGMSNVLLESAASGRPVITTDRPGCREAVDDGINGYLVKERDSADLIEKIEKFLALSHEEKRKMGLCGREKVSREFDRKDVAARYLDAAARLTGSRGSET